jgi:hypothetical protein
MGFLVTLQADQLRLNRFGCPILVNLAWAPTTESARRPMESTTETAPPRTQESSFLRKRSDHQNPVSAQSPSGVRKENVKPTIRNICREDLYSSARLGVLLKHFERAKLVRPCESDRLAFFAAAEHSLRVGKSNACGLFASIVRRRFYLCVSQEDEDAARRKLASQRDGTASLVASGRQGRSITPLARRISGCSDS